MAAAPLFVQFSVIGRALFLKASAIPGPPLKECRRPRFKGRAFANRFLAS
jgi:hypothetical protein